MCTKNDKCMMNNNNKRYGINFATVYIVVMVVAVAVVFVHFLSVWFRLVSTLQNYSRLLLLNIHRQRATCVNCVLCLPNY